MKIQLLSRKRMLAAALAALLPVALSPARAQDTGTKNPDLYTVETKSKIYTSHAGIGDEEASLKQAAILVNQHLFIEAGKVLDRVLERFAALMKDDTRTYVCFTDDADFGATKKTAAAGGVAPDRIVRVQHSYVEALQFKAFIATDKEQWAEAVGFLEKKINVAPYRGGPLTLSWDTPSTTRQTPGNPWPPTKRDTKSRWRTTPQGRNRRCASRSIGCALVDMNRLDDAEDAYKKSLEAEPGNSLALSELEYIKHPCASKIRKDAQDAQRRNKSAPSRCLTRRKKAGRYGNYNIGCLCNLPHVCLICHVARL